MEIQTIKVERIVEDPDQPRKDHNEENRQGLADSIRQHGLLNPITVVPLPNVNMFKIVTGERRWRAAQSIGLESIPCIVKELVREDVLTEQLIENLQREDLQPLEKARAIEYVKADLGATNREVGHRLGLSERAVGYLLDLLDLPEPIAKEVISSPNRPAGGQLTEKHARFLKQLNDQPDLQSAVVGKIRDGKFNSDQTGNLVKALKKRPDRTDEILSSSADHLVQFFREIEPAEAVAETLDSGPARLNPQAQAILNFLPALSAIRPDELKQPEVRQLEDALTSLKLTVDGLLRECRLELGEKV